MNDLMTLLKVSTFEQLLFAYGKASSGMLDFDAIDGGAGVGQTSRQIQKYLNPLRTGAHKTLIPLAVPIVKYQ